MNIGLDILNDPVIKKYLEQFPEKVQPNALMKAMKAGIISLNLIQQDNLPSFIAKDSKKSLKTSKKKEYQKNQEVFREKIQPVVSFHSKGKKLKNCEKEISFEESNKQLDIQKLCAKKNIPFKRREKMIVRDSAYRNKNFSAALDSYRKNKLEAAKVHKNVNKTLKFSERTIELRYITSSSSSDY